MKNLYLTLSVLFLIFGCSSSEPINFENTLKVRESVFYTKDKNKPYNGEVFSLHENGGKKENGILKDGKRNGLWTGWYENGQKWVETTYKDGKGISSKRWNEDGSVKE